MPWMDAATLACPRCHEPLLVARSPNAELHGCRLCGGIWLDGSAAQRLTHALEGPELGLVDAAARHASRAANLLEPVHCPVCATPCMRWNAGGGVEVDTCRSHGTWFDASELRRIAQAALVSRAYGQNLTGRAPPPPRAATTAQGDSDSSVASDVGWGAVDVGLGVVWGLLEIFGD